MSAVLVRAAHGHTCIEQVSPGAPMCGRPAICDVVDRGIIRSFCGLHGVATESGGRYVGIGDEVRHGQGDALYIVEGFDDAVLFGRDNLTGRARRIPRAVANLVIEDKDAYDRRARLGLFNIFGGC